jgi:hypothetical protein
MEKTNAVSLTVNRKLVIEAGVTLVPGVYAGTSKQLGFPRVEDVNWTAPEYTLELTQAQLRDVGVSICGPLSTMLRNSSSLATSR